MRNHEESRCYVDHLLAEHRRLHVMLRQARATILHRGGPAQSAQADDVSRLLRQIRDELVRHFAEEEAGGCMEEAVSRVPGLSERARLIEAEHPVLIQRLDQLIAGVDDYDCSAKHRQEFESEFSSICERLHAHEAAENDVVRRGLGTNVDGDEADEALMQHDE